MRFDGGGRYYMRQKCCICGTTRVEHSPQTDHEFKTIMGHNAPTAAARTTGERFTDIRHKRTRGTDRRYRKAAE